jgi:ABC-2 type transport system permease protein
MIDSLTRIYSQVYKSLISLHRNSFRLADIFVWPLLYLFPLTFFVTYLGTEKAFLDLIIVGMMGWRMVYFINQEMLSSFMEEFWSKSLPNLLISPITRVEFAVGAAITGLIKASFVVILYLLLTSVLYGFWITDWATFILGMAFLAIVSLSLGFVILGFAYYIKMKGDAFNISFIIPDALVLLSGVYFSIESVYPDFMLPLIRMLPTTHAFDVLKSVVGCAKADMGMLLITPAAWLVIAYMFNSFMFEKSRRAGKLANFG